jgi:hypothetical protein
MFDSSPSLLVRLIGKFVSVWASGHGLLAPVYYGILFGLALWAKDRFQLSWTGKKPLAFFVFGISLSHAALCVALISLPLLFLTENGSINPLFWVVFLSNMFAFQALVRSLICTWKNDLVATWKLFKQGLVVTLPSVGLLLLFASSLAGSH